jgi:GTP-binding protein
MIIKDIEFIGSFTKNKQCPQGSIPEFAFIGRSNVGKSSLINMLCGRRSLARVSKTPGKTQQLNYFLINKEWHLVDLPGYGFARTSKFNLRAWEKMIEEYLRLRENLVCTFVLLDLRLEAQQVDIEFINWMGKNEIPFVMVYTKADKLKKREIGANQERIQKEFLKYWNDLPQQFVTSSEKNIGREEMLAFIEDVLNSLEENNE